MYDADCDGLITQNELTVIMRSLGESVTNSDLNDMMKRLGKVDRNARTYPFAKFCKMLFPTTSGYRWFSLRGHMTTSPL